jgi:hypothetical protein
MLYGESESNHCESFKLEQVLSNVSEVMTESENFASFLQSIGKGEEKSNNVTVGFVYHCDRADFFMDESNAVLDWTAVSDGAVKKVSTGISSFGHVLPVLSQTLTLHDCCCYCLISGCKRRAFDPGFHQGLFLPSFQQAPFCAHCIRLRRGTFSAA